MHIWKFSSYTPPWSLKDLFEVRIIEAATGGILWKKVIRNISQNSQVSTRIKVSFLIKLQAWGVFLWISRNFKDQFFTEHLRTTAFRICTNISFCLRTLVDFWPCDAKYDILGVVRKTYFQCKPCARWRDI